MASNLPAKRKQDKQGTYRDSWYLEQELGQKLGFQNWYDLKAQELQADTSMHFLHDERDIAVHFNNSDIHYKLDAKVTFTESIALRDSLKIRVINEDGTEETVLETVPEPFPASKPTETTIEHTWYFDTDRLTGDKEVIVVCEHYIEMLEKLLEDCRQQGFL